MNTSNPPEPGRALGRVASLPARYAALALCLLAFGAWAFPPAPHHIFYGIVRDEMGNPILNTNAVVVLETMAGVQIQTRVLPNLNQGFNYRLSVPMDAGLTTDAYRPTALRPSLPFYVKVKIGATTYLPLELRGSFALMGKPAQRTHLDLTLGEDDDDDGLPDAWERALAAMMGGGLDTIRPEDDADNDGLSNLQEYAAGTYAFDPEDGFKLALAGVRDSRPVFEFLAIRGRSYALYSAGDLKTWQPAEFHFENEPEDAPPRSRCAFDDTRMVRIHALGNTEPMRVFKLQVK